MTWLHPLAAAAGVALMASPGALAYDGSAATSSWIVGPLLASIGFLGSFEVTRPLRYLHAPLAGWLLVAPLAMGFPADAVAASLAAGALALAAAFARGEESGRYAGGWSSLRD